MMDMPIAALEKIRSDDLRNEAVAETSHPHVVIVELDLPVPTLEVATPSTMGLRTKPHFRFSAASAPSESRDRMDASKIQASKENIATITGKLPETYLSTSGSFVVNASGEQIGRIAQMSSVSAIWPNSRRER